MNSEQGPDLPRHSASGSDGKEKRLIERLREAMRSRHYSQRTEKAYWYWMRWFIRFHGKRHPAQMGAAEVGAFLSWLATERNVAAATQNQALSALLFLYKQVLGIDLPWLGDLVRAQRPVRLPTVLGEGEVRRLLACVPQRAFLMVALLYGAGLRQIECVSLRGKDMAAPRARAAFGRFDDDDLHARHEQGRTRGESPLDRLEQRRAAYA